MRRTPVQELAEAVRKRRLELGLTQIDLDSRGGPGVVTVGKIEKGLVKQPSPATLKGLDAALRWRPGSAAGILAGHAPIELTPEDPPVFDVIHAIRNDPHLLPEAREHLERQYGLLLRVQRQPDEDAAVAEAVEDAKQVVRSINEAKQAAPDKGGAKRRR